MTKRIGETYDGLWGELMVFMHDMDYLWQTNEGRADWLESLGFGGGLRILDLGCGNGLLDIALARRGHVVTGVDSVASVLARARRHVEHESVDFLDSDLRVLELPSNHFDLVLMFGLVGLMSVEDDRTLLQRARHWLKEGGKLLVESDLNLAEEQRIESDHPDGVVQWNWSSDPKTRTNVLLPELHRTDGTIVELRDPIDPKRGNHAGLLRYLYPPAELEECLQQAGFVPKRIGHFLEYVFPEADRDRYMLLGELPAID